MKERHHVAVQMEEEQQWIKDNGPIDKTADQLWKYSGEIEKDSEEYINIKTEITRIKAFLPKKSRKEYFRLYWLKTKNKRNEKNNNKNEYK